MTLAENLSDVASLSFKKPLPIMLHEDNTKVEVLMEFNDGINTSCYKKIAPPRNHGVDKLEVMEEHNRVLCKLGVQHRMGPDEKPQNVMETVFARAKVIGPDGKIIPGWRPCRDPTNSLNKDTKNVDIAGYQLTDRTVEFSGPDQVQFMLRMDMPKAFHLTVIAKESLPFNVVCGVNGFYQMLQGYFGWKGMPAIFHNATADLAEGYVRNVKKQVDNILAHAATLEEFFAVTIAHEAAQHSHQARRQATDFPGEHQLLKTHHPSKWIHHAEAGQHRRHASPQGSKDQSERGPHVAGSRGLDPALCPINGRVSDSILSHRQE